MNKRQKKKNNKNCESCNHFIEWDNFTGQYDNFGRCELSPYFVPVCKVWDKVENEYPEMLDIIDFDFTEYIKLKTKKKYCKYFKKGDKENDDD